MSGDTSLPAFNATWVTGLGTNRARKTLAQEQAREDFFAERMGVPVLKAARQAAKAPGGAEDEAPRSPR